MVGRLGHGEGLLKGAADLNIYMYVLGKLEMSIKQCHKGDFSVAQLSLDESAAYYSGSLSLPEVEESGKFLYYLADERARNFRTAGRIGDKGSGTAYVNINVLSEMQSMQSLFKTANVTNCDVADSSVKRISNLMKIPIIQSVLAYAFIREYDDEHSQDEVEKAEGKGATYLAAVIPYIHNCNEKSAQVIYENMRVGSNTKDVNFDHVKKSLEGVYQCLGVTCSDIGGIWNADLGDYAKGARPCGLPEPETGMSGGGVFGLTAACVLCAFLAFRYRNKLPMSLRRRGNKGDMSVGTIAAVSEIS